MKKEKCEQCKLVDHLAPSGSYCAEHNYENPSQRDMGEGHSGNTPGVCDKCEPIFTKQTAKMYKIKP
jgi:hypothetical protein